MVPILFLTLLHRLAAAAVVALDQLVVAEQHPQTPEGREVLVAVAVQKAAPQELEPLGRETMAELAATDLIPIRRAAEAVVLVPQVEPGTTERFLLILLAPAVLD